MCVLIVSAFSYGLSFVHRPNKCFRFSIRECCLIFLANKKDILLFVNVAVSTKYAMCVHLQRLLYFTVIISIQNNYQLCDSLGWFQAACCILRSVYGFHIRFPCRSSTIIIIIMLPNLGLSRTAWVCWSMIKQWRIRFYGLLFQVRIRNHIEKGLGILIG